MGRTVFGSASEQCCQSLIMCMLQMELHEEIYNSCVMYHAFPFFYNFIITNIMRLGYTQIVNQHKSLFAYKGLFSISIITHIRPFTSQTNHTSNNKYNILNNLFLVANILFLSNIHVNTHISFTHNTGDIQMHQFSKNDHNALYCKLSQHIFAHFICEVLCVNISSLHVFLTPEIWEYRITFLANTISCCMFLQCCTSHNSMRARTSR